ncbi:MAG: metallopeptidase [Verrucomicrobiota bacterium]
MRKFLVGMLALIAGLPWGLAQEGGSPNEAIVIPRTEQEIHGFTIRVDNQLLSGDHETLGKNALDLLRADLTRIRLVVPERVVKIWQKYPIVIDFDHPLTKNMQYHPSQSWLVNNGYEASLAKCVHVASAKRYYNADHYFVQPSVLFHELAHAYHDQELGFENPKIAKAFARAQLQGQYKQVLHVKGHTTQHYALTNPKEYFAEGTEAWFGTNDFYPYVRSELKEHDPRLFELLKEFYAP